VIVDESQDFSANQIRAVKMQLAEEHTAIFVLDTTQRIYARGFTWQEVGITVRPENSHRLTKNYRNSQEIAKFAAGILTGLAVDDDGSTPDFSKADRSGEMPQVLLGKFSTQIAYAIEFIAKRVDLKTDSVAFLHAKGGGLV
jgi:DNA helicase IV